LTSAGIFGNGTRDAVMAAQSIFGLTVDGTVGPMTWDRLMREAVGNIAGLSGGVPPRRRVPIGWRGW